MFLNTGRIVSTKTRGGELDDRFEAEPGTLVDLDKPLAVLIDGNSASASEIVAACLQDNRRSAIVGSRSFGKGTVQNILPLQYGRSALRLTIARYYRPNGENIHRKQNASDSERWGVTPDEGLVVELDEASLRRLAQHWREASYPSLAASRSELTTTPDETDDEPLDQEPSTAPSGNPLDDASELSIDPQLRRAVEHLHEQMHPTQAVAAAAA
jgi:carboxyl-terminal processing protease